MEKCPWFNFWTNNYLLINRIVYDIDCCRITDDLRAHEDSISCLAWSKNGFLITCSLDCTARIWKAPQAPWTKIELITSLKAELEHENKVTSLTLSVWVIIIFVQTKPVAY